MSSAEEECVDRARRRLLKAGLYVAPVIATFGVFARPALAITSCNPQPCSPLPCGPPGHKK